MEKPEQDIRRALLELSAIFASAPVGLCMLDRDLRYLHVNALLARTNGVPVEAHIGRTVREVVGEEAGLVEPILYRVMETREPFEGLELSRPDAGTGEVRHWLFSFSPLLTDGDVAGVVGTTLDITERRRSEQAMRESEARFRNLVQNSYETIAQVAADGTILYISPSIQRTAGWSTEERVGRSNVEFIHPDDRGRMRHAMEAVLAGEAEATIEFRYLNARHEWRRMEAHLTKMVGAPHKDSLVINSRDVTERYEAEVALRESEQRNRLIMDTALDAVIVMDARETVLEWNGQAEAIFGWEREEAVGNSLTELIVPPLHRSAHERGIKHFLATGEGPLLNRRVETTALHRKGHEFPVELAVTPMEVNGAWVFGAFLRDITERKRAEKALYESELRYRSLSRLVSTFAYSYDVPAEGVPTMDWITSSVEEVLGVPASHFVGKPWGAAVSEENRAASMALLDGALAGESEIKDMPIRAKDGELRWVRFVLQPEVDAATGRVVRIYGAGQDVTAQKAAEAELVAAKERAEEMTRLKDAFLANMSHEIRTPLTSILGFAEILKDEVEGEARQFVELIDAGGRRLKETLTSVLELSQLQAGRIALTPTRLDVAALVRETVDLLRAQASRKGITITDGSGDASVIGDLDRAALARILTNLAGNAVKFTNEGGDIIISAAGEGDLVTIKVVDTGVGISPEFMPHLFEEFRQESVGLGRSHEGNGLGMAITKRLVDLLGGSIEVESEKGRGTTVAVKLPRGAVAVKEVRPPSPVEAPHVARRRVLLVEDDENTRLFVRHALKDAVIVEAVSARAALAVADGEGRFSVVFLDINLGEGVSGLELLPELRTMRACRDARFVAMTAYALSGDEERFRAGGFDDYLPKPFTRAALRQVWHTNAEAP